MSYYQQRVEGMQREAMELIYTADTERGLSIAVRNEMYARAAALCALARCETWSGSLTHPVDAVNAYFEKYQAVVS